LLAIASVRNGMMVFMKKDRKIKAAATQAANCIFTELTFLFLIFPAGWHGHPLAAALTGGYPLTAACFLPKIRPCRELLNLLLHLKFHVFSICYA